MLTRADVERIIDNKFSDNSVLTENVLEEKLLKLLKDNLTIAINDGGVWGDEDRVVTIEYKGTVICKTGFNID